MVHTFNPNSWEAETGMWVAYIYEIRDSLIYKNSRPAGHTGRTCLKTKPNQTKSNQTKRKQKHHHQNYFSGNIIYTSYSKVGKSMLEFSDAIW